MLVAPQIPRMPVANLTRLTPSRVSRAGRSAYLSIANMLAAIIGYNPNAIAGET